MDEELKTALAQIVAIDDDTGLFDRIADRDHYRSEKLEAALDVIGATLEAYKAS